MTAHRRFSHLLSLRSARDELALLNRTVSHCLCLATEKDLLAGGRAGQHARRVPATWGARRDTYFWDSWDWSVRGEDDLRRFFEIARRIGSRLRYLEATPAAALVSGTVEEIVGTRSNLYLPDYWLFVVHHLGWTDQLPYECETHWTRGSTFADEPFSMTSRLPVNVVQASIDALTVLIDAVPQRIWDREAGGYVDFGPFTADGSIPGESAVAMPDRIAARDRSETANGDGQRESGTSHGAGDGNGRHNGQSQAAVGRRVDRPRLKKRAVRTANMEALKKELVEHIRAARDHAQAAVDFGSAPELLPRPSQRELARRVGITESAASRCFSDPAATELKLLWETADDLEAVMKFLRH